MAEGGHDLAKIVAYMKGHWPSKVKPEWQVELVEYPEILPRVIKDLSAGKSQGRELVRIAGLSGSGKTTQLLPATEAYFEKRDKRPVLVAAREFVKYHPHHDEILDFYGAENLRKMTDEFATIMMFMAISELIKNGYDIILDVTLLDPEMEAILVGMLQNNQYQTMLMMVAVSPEVTEKFLSGRAWRHTKETEQEFIRATKKALEFYAEKMPEARMVMWNTYETTPIYDGAIKNSVEIFDKYSSETSIPDHDEEKLKIAKIEYLK